MKKYAIWNKKDRVITPDGKVWTAQQWMEKHPVAALDDITVICSAGEINGALFGTLGQMVNQYESMGCDFSSCNTDAEKLEAIEAFDTSRQEAESLARADAVDNQELTATSLASIAASLEYQNMLTLEDVEVQ